MARVSTYVSFQGQTEEAFTFYAGVFGTEVSGLTRFGDMRAVGPAELPAEAKSLVMHVELPILGGHLLMATDVLESMGQHAQIGNNMTICLDVDTRQEADRLYGELAQGGSEGAPMADMPWGAYGASSSTATAPLDGQFHEVLNRDEHQEVAWAG